MMLRARMFQIISSPLHLLHLAKNLSVYVCVFKNPQATSEEMLKQITIDPTCQSVQVTVNNLGSRAQRQSVSSN